MKKTLFFSLLTIFLAATATHPASAATDISLSEAVSLALRNNLGLALVKEDVNIAEADITALRGEFDIFLSGSGSFLYEEITPITAGGATEEETASWAVSMQKKFITGTELELSWINSNYQDNSGLLLFDPLYTTGLSVSINQPLLKGFGISSQTAPIKAAEKVRDASSYSVTGEAADLAAEVTTAYWNLVYAWQDIEVKRLALQLAEKLLAETKEMIAAGSLAEIDLYRPESEVALREQELISAEKAIGAAEDFIKLLINDSNWFTPLNPTDRPLAEKIEIDPAQILETALAQRPDIKAADLQTEAALMQKRKARNDLLPDLTLQGKYGVSGRDSEYADSVDNSFTDSDSLWQVGVTFSMPLSNRTARGKHDRAAAIYTQAKVNADLIRQRVHQLVRTTVRDLELAMKTIEATQKTTFATQKGLEAEEIKFQAGRATTVDVLSAQKTYAQALSQENLARVMYAQTLAELYRIQGKIPAH